MSSASWHLGLKFIRRAFSGVNLAFGMLTRECFLECTFNWLDYSTGIKDETQTHCFTGFSRMVSLVIPNVGFASLLTQSPHLILGCAWTAANTNSCCLLETQTLFWPKKGETKTLFWHDDGLSSQKHSRDCLVSINSQTILMSQTLQRCRCLDLGFTVAVVEALAFLDQVRRDITSCLMG